MSRLSINNSLIEPRYSNYLAFQRISFNHTNKQHFLEAILAYFQVCHSVIKHLTHFRYTKEQVSCLLSDVPLEERI